MWSLTLHDLPLSVIMDWSTKSVQEPKSLLFSALKQHLSCTPVKQTSDTKGLVWCTMFELGVFLHVIYCWTTPDLTVGSPRPHVYCLCSCVCVSVCAHECVWQRYPFHPFRHHSHRTVRGNECVNKSRWGMSGAFTPPSVPHLWVRSVQMNRSNTRRWREEVRKGQER